MSKPGKQASEADVAQAAHPNPGELAKGTPKTMKATGQKVSLERGRATNNKKNPGKRPKAGGS